MRLFNDVVLFVLYKRQPSPFHITYVIVYLANQMQFTQTCDMYQANHIMRGYTCSHSTFRHFYGTEPMLFYSFFTVIHHNPLQF